MSTNTIHEVLEQDYKTVQYLKKKPKTNYAKMQTKFLNKSFKEALKHYDEKFNNNK